MMNTDGHQALGDGPVNDEQQPSAQALVLLRRQLAEGVAAARLSKTQLAAKADVSRTTVYEALRDGGPVPTLETVTALARALKLPAQELQALQRDAAGGEGEGGERPGPGRPIGEWEPHDLEVHPAGPRTAAPDSSALPARVLPGYVPRDHDRQLEKAVRDAAEGRSRIVVLVGTSSTGKTRACWEAVQPLADRGWRLWHPFDPTRAEAALQDLHHVQPRTVVWLNEAQHYIGNRAAGEQIAAAVHHLLVTPERGPVLVLATLWPEYAHQYMTVPAPGGEDPHSRARELLSGRTLSIPDSFDAPALTAAAALADKGDRLLADALTRAHTNGQITQDLAGAPELLTRYQQASPAARALLEAAMDARRLGVGLHLPQAFLTDAATDYLSQTDYDQLTDNWAEAAFAELAEPVHGKQAPLRRTTPRPLRRPPAPSTAAGLPAPGPAGPVFRLADYLEEHGATTRRQLCPPASFWYAAHTHLTHPDDLFNLTVAAKDRHRLQWAHHLQHRAADHGSTDALFRLAKIREQDGDREGAEALYRRAADHGSTDALFRLAEIREQDGDREGAEALAGQAADHVGPSVLVSVAKIREEAGDREAAEALYRQAADHGSTRALRGLAGLRWIAGDWEGAEALYLQAADHGDTFALLQIALRREQAGNREGAEALARQAANHGVFKALFGLALWRRFARDWEGAETLYRQAADHGHTSALINLAELREIAGDRQGAEALYRQAADHGHTSALINLAELRESAGDRQGAEALARQAADHGHTDALEHLAVWRERNGDRAGAEALYRQAADRGSTQHVHWANNDSHVLETLWPFGLDPDGTPTPRWH
ncbi:helix-turn-helix domain-containing protein [Streptomyces sp. NPDC002952]|uniref:helix-turn-helix domain-containing protein n=2 Tax=unclassified Streptomyces TaxID=2593676 RepID=UPI0036779BFA